MVTDLSENEHLLSVQELVVQYGVVRALAGVSIAVPVGGAVGVIGANGAGKTSLARAIAGLVPVASGRISFAGTDIGGLSAQSRASRGISLVPEGRGVIGDLTVEENLLVGGYKNRDRRALRRDLEQMYTSFPQLIALRKRRARVLSGGELQLLAIARAMMSRPRLLIIDEPSMGLSPIAVSHVREVLRVLRKADVSLLLFEQNVSVAYDVCDEVYSFVLGKVARREDPGEAPDRSEIESIYFGSDEITPE